jgi:hypothetical protein
VLEGVRQALLAEGQLADGPDLGVGLERLLDLGVERAALERDDLGRRVRVVGDRGAALGAEEAPDALAGAALALVLLDRTVDGELVLWNYADEGWLRRGVWLADDVWSILRGKV